MNIQLFVIHVIPSIDFSSALMSLYFGVFFGD